MSEHKPTTWWDVARALLPVLLIAVLLLGIFLYQYFTVEVELP